MFEPISARLASSFSRKGISAAATETSCFGDTSMNSTFSRGVMMTSPARRQTTRSSVSMPLGVDRRVGLRDVVLRLFHRGEVDDLVRHLAVDDLATIRRLDEAVLVDAREGRQRVDQTDVRTFRRLDRADAAVVRRMRRAPRSPRVRASGRRSERRETTLVRDLRQRIGLVHELRELRGAEELANGSRRLGVDQVLRHDRVDVDPTTCALDRALHAQQQAEAILVSISSPTERTRRLPRWSMSSISPRPSRRSTSARTTATMSSLRSTRTCRCRRIEVEAHVHLHAADGRRVVALGIEEQRMEHRFRRLDGRRLARTHDAIDVEQRLLARSPFLSTASVLRM